MRERVQSIDITRGIVMIIMALDHVRDIIHNDSLQHNPTDLSTTTTFLFFTRWITHICAPTFVFLSGVSVFLTLQRMSIKETRVYLLKRGLLLILLDFTIVCFGLWWDIHFNVLLFNVIAAIGVGLIILSLLLKLPGKIIAIIGLVILFTHNLAPMIPGSEESLFKKFFMPFFAPGATPFGEGKFFVMGYPPIPWLGIMLTGFGLGHLFLEPNVVIRRKKFLWLGILSVGWFVVLRVINSYGETIPWTTQKNPLFTFLSFINVTKYSPSLQFCLLFLGVMFLILYLVEGAKNRLTAFTVVYGKVPLFYFLVHWYIIHPLLFFILFAQGYGIKDFSFGFNFGRPATGVSGLNLAGVYIIWICVVLLMYPLCKWYCRYKHQYKGKKWLSYL